jgi:hypothetical protein
MKRWIILAVLAVVFSTVGTVAVQYLGASPTSTGQVFPTLPPVKVTGPQPKAVLIGEQTHEFGTLPQRHTGKKAWTVKNEGKGDLKLHMIRSTCSCTLAKFKDGKDAVVKPGESTEIALEFETRDNNGEYKKGAEIGTNDPVLPSFSLYVHGKIVPALFFYPGRAVALQSISTDKDDHIAHIGIYSKDRPDVKVLKATSSKPSEIIVSTEPMTSEECKGLKIEKGIKVTVNVKSTLPLGEFREDVVLTTDHPSEPEVHIPVTGKMSGPVNVLPERLQWRRVDGKAGAQQTMTISVRGGRETKIELEKAPKNLKVEIGPSNPPRKGQYQLTLIVPPGTPADDIEDEIVLKTDHAKAERVIVPVSIFIQSPP